MRENDLKKLFTTESQDLMIWTRCSALFGHLLSAGKVADASTALSMVRDIAEQREYVELQRQAGRNTPEEDAKLKASVHPLEEFIYTVIAEPLERVREARKDHDVEKLRAAIRDAEEFKGRVVPMVKEQALAVGMAEPDALKLAQAMEKEYAAGLLMVTSVKSITRKQAMGELGFGK